MKGEDENKWDTDLEKQIYCHKQSTKILLVAMGGASNNLRAQLVILPLVLFFKVHCLVCFPAGLWVLSPKFSCATKANQLPPGLHASSPGKSMLSTWSKLALHDPRHVDAHQSGWRWRLTVPLTGYCQMLKGTSYGLTPNFVSLF